MRIIKDTKKLSFVKLKYKLRGIKAKITRMKNMVPKFKTKEEIVDHIIKRNEEVLKPSKKALKSFRRTLLTANEDLLRRELKDTERLLTMLKTA
jgi:DNA-binding ferritin-like protein